jgi:hypothetical protein
MFIRRIQGAEASLRVASMNPAPEVGRPPGQHRRDAGAGLVGETRLGQRD